MLLFHGNSKIAVAALEAAKKQNLYWESMDILFERQPQWGSHHHPRIDLIFEFLPEVGIDVDRLKKDMQNPEIARIISTRFHGLKAIRGEKDPHVFC